MKYFVTAIGTDSGKTLVSAIISQALKADYWKPIQAGIPTDTETVRKLVANTQSVFHKEAYLLKNPVSPHAAARMEGLQIDLATIGTVQQSNADLVIEGAGGVLVPINDDDFVIDIAEEIQAEIVLVANLYLGSINHTLLTVDYLNRNGFKVKGIIFNGESNPESEEIIELHSGYKVLLRLPKLGLINQEVVSYWAEELLLNWYE